MRTFYHYCCRHSANRITRYGLLKPSDASGMFQQPIVWLTDQGVPDRDGLGLTSHLTGLRCDRLEYRYVVEDGNYLVQRWLDSDVRRRLSAEPYFVQDFEGGRQPETWFICTQAIWAERDRGYHPPIVEDRAGTVVYTRLK